MTNEYAIERLQDKLKCMEDGAVCSDFGDDKEVFRLAIKALEQEPRKGHWTEEFNDIDGEVRFTCSCCGKYQLFGTDFCYNCGAKMVEPQESEGT